MRQLILLLQTGGMDPVSVDNWISATFRDVDTLSVHWIGM